MAMNTPREKIADQVDQMRAAGIAKNVNVPVSTRRQATRLWRRADYRASGAECAGCAYSFIRPAPVKLGRRAGDWCACVLDLIWVVPLLSI